MFSCTRWFWSDGQVFSAQVAPSCRCLQKRRPQSLKPARSDEHANANSKLARMGWVIPAKNRCDVVMDLWLWELRFYMACRMRLRGMPFRQLRSGEARSPCFFLRGCQVPMLRSKKTSQSDLWRPSFFWYPPFAILKLAAGASCNCVGHGQV